MRFLVKSNFAPASFLSFLNYVSCVYHTPSFIYQIIVFFISTKSKQLNHTYVSNSYMFYICYSFMNAEFFNYFYTYQSVFFMIAHMSNLSCLCLLKSYLLLSCHLCFSYFIMLDHHLHYLSIIIIIVIFR